MEIRGKQETSQNDLAYLAGIMDSDGCISISKWPAMGNRTDRYVLELTVVNTSETLMRWLVEKWGGWYKSRRRVSEKHKETFDWKFTNNRAVEILEQILPYLVVKSAQAKNGMAFVKENTHKSKGQGGKLGSEEIARREYHYQTMKALNKFGPVQPQRLNSSAPANAG